MAGLYDALLVLAQSLVDDAKEMSCSLKESRGALREEMNKPKEQRDTKTVDGLRRLERSDWRDKNALINVRAEVAKSFGHCPHIAEAGNLVSIKAKKSPKISNALKENVAHLLENGPAEDAQEPHEHASKSKRKKVKAALEGEVQPTEAAPNADAPTEGPSGDLEKEGQAKKHKSSKKRVRVVAQDDEQPLGVALAVSAKKAELEGNVGQGEEAIGEVKAKEQKQKKKKREGAHMPTA